MIFFSGKSVKKKNAGSTLLWFSIKTHIVHPIYFLNLKRSKPNNIQNRNLPVPFKISI